MTNNKTCQAKPGADNSGINAYQTLRLSATELFEIFEGSVLASDTLLSILAASMHSREMNCWDEIERSEATDICRLLIKLLRTIEISNNDEDVDEVVSDIFTPYEKASIVSNILLKILGSAMSSETADLWDFKDRSNATHLCRHTINVLQSAELLFKEQEDKI